MLVDERMERGVAQARLATLMGISASYLNLVEKGKRRPPTDDWLIRWGVALGMGDDEISSCLDVAKVARLGWKRWKHASQVQEGRRDQSAAYDYVESLIAGARELDVVAVLRRDGAQAHADIAGDIECRRLCPQGTLHIEARFVPREAAM
ncbi:MAG: helix-turn-helix domain-containing protein [Burkholderiaceae bacterium]